MDHPVQAYGYELHWFKCDCGNGKFEIYDEEFDERGVVEFGFSCECGKDYHFAYGDVIEIKEES